MRGQRRGNDPPRRCVVLSGGTVGSVEGVCQRPQDAGATRRRHPPAGVDSHRRGRPDHDVFTAAGLPRPDIGILSEQFLAEVRGLKHRNVAAELLERLLKDELRVRANMGDDTLRVIATELITQVRKSVTIDWNLRESARARIRVLVKRILNKYGYPPDLQEEAVRTVLMQAELLCGEWMEQP